MASAIPPLIISATRKSPISRGSSSSSSSRDSIYVAAMPLRASKGPAQMFMSLTYSSLNLWDFQHYIVIIRPPNSTSSPQPDQMLYLNLMGPLLLLVSYLLVVLSQIVMKFGNFSVSLIQAFVFDFQPQDPENIQVAIAALSGGRVPGTVLVRKLTKLPKRKCWFVGFSSVGGGISKANKFSELWDTDLRIGQHDCRNYTNELVECLTGEKHVLERLRGSVEG